MAIKELDILAAALSGPLINLSATTRRSSVSRQQAQVINASRDSQSSPLDQQRERLVRITTMMYQGVATDSVRQLYGFNVAASAEGRLVNESGRTPGARLRNAQPLNIYSEQRPGSTRALPEGQSLQPRGTAVAGGREPGPDMMSRQATNTLRDMEAVRAHEVAYGARGIPHALFSNPGAPWAEPINEFQLPYAPNIPNTSYTANGEFSGGHRTPLERIRSVRQAFAGNPDGVTDTDLALTSRRPFIRPGRNSRQRDAIR